MYWFGFSLQPVIWLLTPESSWSGVRSPLKSHCHVLWVWLYGQVWLWGAGSHGQAWQSPGAWTFVRPIVTLRVTLKWPRKGLYCVGVGIRGKRMTAYTDAELNAGGDRQERRDTPREHSTGALYWGTEKKLASWDWCRRTNVIRILIIKEVSPQRKFPSWPGDVALSGNWYMKCQSP